MELFSSERTTCPLCGSASKNSRKICDLVHQGKSIEVRECFCCGLIYKMAIPSAEGFAGIYNEGYVHHTRQNFDNSVKFLASRLERLPIRYGKLLDFGCGSGAFVHAAHEIGFDSYGLDPFLPDRHTLENDYLKAHCYRSDISSPTSHPALIHESFDVITMWATVEHSVNPGIDFAHMASYLNPGGFLVFNSPAGDSLACRKSCRHWNMALLPEHLQFFTRASVVWFAENARMRMVHVRNCGSPYPFGLSGPRSTEPSLSNEQLSNVIGGRSARWRTKSGTVALPRLFHKAYQSLYRHVILNDSLKVKSRLSAAIGLLQLGDHIEVVLQKC